MLEVLSDLQYKIDKTLPINVTANGNNYPSDSQQTINGRIQYNKSFLPKYVEDAINYTVLGLESNETLVQNYIDLKSSYDPIDLLTNYLSGTVYNALPQLNIPFYIYWYDQVNLFSDNTIFSLLSSQPLYQQFSNSVGSIMLYSDTEETVDSASYTSSIKSYNRTIENLIQDSLRSSIDQGFADANGPYCFNISNLAGSGPSTSAHGQLLVADNSNTTRYQNASAGYLSLLLNNYMHLMYLTPFYVYSTQSASLSFVPYFTSNINGLSVIVNILGKKVDSDYGWYEQNLLEAQI
jgi:hypothetical protein